MKTIGKIFCCLLIFLAMSGLASTDELKIWTVGEPPGNFVDEKGEITGLSVDYVREIQRRVGNKSDIRMLPWQRIYLTALNKPNIVLFSMARTPEREDKFHWIALVMRKPWAFYAKKGSGLRIKSLEDAGKVGKIGVLRGDVRAEWLGRKGISNLDEATDHKLNIEKLLRGRLDLIFYSPHGAAHICRELGVDFDELEPMLFPHMSLSHIAMSKNGTPPETVRLWQETAQKIKDDGTFQKLAEKWAKYTIEKDGIDAEVKDGALNFWKKQ